MVLLAILVFFLLSASPVSAIEPILTIQSIPASAILGESFNLNFDFQNAIPNTAYYFKIYENSDTKKSIEINVNGSWQNSYLNVDWLLMPQFTTDSSGGLNQALEIRANAGTEKISGDYQLYLKSVLVSTKNNPSSSQPHTIQINDPPPSPSPTSSSTPENTPVNTPTLVPTQSPSSEPSLTINSWPSSADLGQSFTITFTLDNIEPQTEYYVKAYEDSDTNKSLEVFVNDSWQSSYKTVPWELMPKFSSDNSPINRDLQLRAKPDKNSGDYQIYLKAALSSDTNKSYLSSVKTISVNSTDPSNTPVPTETPTPTLSVSPTITPTPSISPTSSPTPAGIDTISDESDSSILGIQDIKITPTPKPKKSISTPANLIPKIFIGLGTLCLLVPLLITKIKKC